MSSELRLEPRQRHRDSESGEDEDYSVSALTGDFFCVTECYFDLPDVELTFSVDKEVELRLSGPMDPENLSLEPLTIDHPNLGGFCVSTYPQLPGRTVRSGDPIADCFQCLIQKDGSMLASIADGCNWGSKSRDAARTAAANFFEYLMKRSGRWTAVQAGHLFLRAFAEAHESILRTKQAIWECGTTTLLGALVSPIQDSANWLFLVCSVGDSRAYVFSAKTNQVRMMSGPPLRGDASDPGGRLGPHLEHGHPDLRNLILTSSVCSPGDILILMTDGVYDNLDPVNLAVSPQDCGLAGDVWSDDDATLEIREKYIRDVIRDKLIGDASSPAEISKRVCAWVAHVTEASRDFHAKNPNKKLPKDFRLYPGKMDHSTCLVYTIPGAVPGKQHQDVDDSSSSSSSSSTA